LLFISRLDLDTVSPYHQVDITVSTVNSHRTEKMKTFLTKTILRFFSHLPWASNILRPALS